MMNTAPVGVVVMAYGTPRHRDEIEAYYTDIRRGRPPTPEQLADLERRYAAIGGLSPMAARTEAQRSALASALGDGYVVVTGLRHATPTIEDAVNELSAHGVDRVVGLVLAPHYSAMSVGVYNTRAAAAAGTLGLPYRGIESWATEPAYIEFLTGALRAVLGDDGETSQVRFTAHSLPERIVAEGDPYPAEVASTAAAVAAALDLGDRWKVCWQSAGRTPEAWLGPDVLAVIDELGGSSAPGSPSKLVVCPCGFVSDHLEVLYDLDIEATQRAADVGVQFRRTPVVNDDPLVMSALASRIVALARNPA